MVYDHRMVAMCVLFHSALGSKVPGNDFIKRLHRFSTANYLNSELKVTKKSYSGPTPTLGQFHVLVIGCMEGHHNLHLAFNFVNPHVINLCLIVYGFHSQKQRNR